MQSAQVRRSEVVAATKSLSPRGPPGTDATGMATAESSCRRTEHLGQGRRQTNSSILPDISPAIMLRPDADGAVAERQLAA